MGKRIAIAPPGTLGDVQPFVALALTLRKRGYSVVIASTDDCESYVTTHGVEFFSLGGDIQAFLRQSQFDSAMTKSLILYATMLLGRGQGSPRGRQARVADGAGCRCDRLPEQHHVLHGHRRSPQDSGAPHGLPAAQSDQRIPLFRVRAR